MDYDYRKPGRGAVYVLDTDWSIRKAIVPVSCSNGLVWTWDCKTMYYIDMIRKAFVMAVNPDQHLEYERRHGLLWPELAQVFHDHGVHKFSIFLHEKTHQLFAYTEIESEEQLLAIAETPTCKKW